MQSCKLCLNDTEQEMKKRHIKYGHIPFIAVLWIVSACKRKPGQKKKIVFRKNEKPMKMKI